MAAPAPPPARPVGRPLAVLDVPDHGAFVDTRHARAITFKPREPWRTIGEVDLATAKWVDWFDYRRLSEYCGDVPPVDLGAADYAQPRIPAAGRVLKSESLRTPRGDS